MEYLGRNKLTNTDETVVGSSLGTTSMSSSSSGTYSLFSSFHGGIQPGALDGSGLLHSGLSGMQMGTSNDPLEAVLGPFPCARLRGLPFDAMPEDVLAFFQGLVVLDVVVVANSFGRGSGEAFVVFPNPMDFQVALQRDRQSMGHRYIEVFQGKRSDYYAAIASLFKQAGQSELPAEGETIRNTQDSSVQGNAWSGPAPPSSPDAVLIPLMQQLGSGGVSNHAPGTTAVGSNAGASKGSGGASSVGSREGRATGDGARGAKGGHPGRGMRQGGGIQVGEHTGYLRMRGLPFSASKKDIFEFFKEYKPIEDSIVLTYRGDGRATGEGYIAFNQPNDAEDAMSLHKSTMGSRYIELFISHKEEHARAVSRGNGGRSIS
eukprot:CAMPEP_0197824720 /NCGR_PEP_ID=MMETSP1437-20131217/1940_1 /TAXON_ID=49252 ORGANISM="Eucampia antarctica, Strain CCMP1452" /NCGR_SAMPLE_ID=MMETSP1437 /ASSEMBLY_ACC=CAM_ASM_001096 /LENGTH=375 /DNA_ID=CAMNT_0043424463 /DNA_START=132 /DNA_END=1259 /DNA_ORIENTATION=+